MNKKEMDRCRRALEKQRERIVRSLEEVEKSGLINQEYSVGTTGITTHPADLGTDNFERDLGLGLVTEEHDLLKEIDEALDRIERGIFGECEKCGCAIPRERLNAIPQARNCLECQKKAEG